MDHRLRPGAVGGEIVKAVVGIVGIVALVVVGALALEIVTDQTAPENLESVWSYDDYKTIDGVTSATGSLELVETSAGTLVHASDVGIGSYVVDGVETEVEVSRALLDVVLITGQSNSTYIERFVSNSEASPLPDPGTAYVWARPNGDYSYLYKPGQAPSMMDMVTPDGVARTGSVAPAFASEYTELTGSKMYFVAGGMSSQKVSAFDPETGISWGYMRDVLTDALRAVDEDRFVLRGACYLWIQGESDWNTAVDLYKQRFMTMHDAIMRGELGMSFGHCFISLPAQDDSVNAYTAQRQLAAENPGTVTIATDVADTFSVENGLLQSDMLHYTSQGYNMVGERLGESAGAYYAADPLPVPASSLDNPLVQLWPVILGIGVGVGAVQFAARLVMGRD